MIAFAANSVLTRLALADGLVGAADFASIRILSGAIVLAALVWFRRRRVFDAGEVSVLTVAGLSLYAIGFSYAYVSLETGTGALILFGGVQVTMFAGALFAGERPGKWRWIGSAVALSGLVYLLAPSGQAPDLFGAVLMAAAGIGWGCYSLVGRNIARPLEATAANFLFSIPVAAVIWLAIGDPVAAAWNGIILAAVSGGVTSGLGYALWYSVLPKLDRSLAAIAQLTVPVIALAGGVVFLGEGLSLRFALASILVLGGIGISIRR